MAKETGKEKSQDIAPTVQTRAARALSPFEEMDELFDRVFDRGWPRPLQWERPLWERLSSATPKMPKVDVVDRDKEVLVRAEIPGVDRKDLDVSVNDNTVIIKGQTSSETKEEKGDFFRSEITRGTFSRTVALPADVDGDKASARLTDGVLELTLPKLKESRRRKVEVK